MKFLAPSLGLLAVPTLALAQAETVVIPSAKGSTVIKLFDREMIDKWAQCSWTKLPVTAQNLVDLSSGAKRVASGPTIPFADPERNLLTRLNVACGSLLRPEDRDSISFGTIRAKKLAIAERRPAQPGLKDEKTNVFVCTHSASGRIAFTELELPKPKPKRQMSGTIVNCYRIESDGSLSNA